MIMGTLTTKSGYYDCSLDGEHWTTIFGETSGQAKMDYYRKLDMDINYLDIKCRKNKTYTPVIEKEFVPSFKQGDKCVMANCFEATVPEYKGKVWTCRTDSYIDKAKEEVVFLERFSGCFCAEYLVPINL